MGLTIKEMQEEAGRHAKSKGFHDVETNVGELLMLVVTEAAEAMEDYRDSKKPDGMASLGFELKDLAFWDDDGGGPYTQQRSPGDIAEELAEFEVDWAKGLQKPHEEGDGGLKGLDEARLAEIKTDQIAHIKRLYKPCGLPSELADVIIRCGDLACRLGIDLETAILEKQKYNRTRAFMHGGKAV
jgi:NTP pyrophosphatase (non-canonical NTP hydrolase)